MCGCSQRPKLKSAQATQRGIWNTLHVILCICTAMGTVHWLHAPHNMGCRCTLALEVLDRLLACPVTGFIASWRSTGCCIGPKGAKDSGLPPTLQLSGR